MRLSDDESTTVVENRDGDDGRRCLLACGAHESSRVEWCGGHGRSCCQVGRRRDVSVRFVFPGSVSLGQCVSLSALFVFCSLRLLGLHHGARACSGWNWRGLPPLFLAETER
ncbi:hypothetical protein KC19_4G007900 [Ceratodon purpureus]|uniref:Uncharacterized protein n=1 Tax=Ceratodon purpureus TaxID=3225 RepID=A0A8T0I567_CERPU|nr:hypothetical protein KC19_4G007900 [Ceratodon purpureus]